MDSSDSGSSEFYKRYRHMSSRDGIFLYIFADKSKFTGWVRFGRLFVEIMTMGTFYEVSTILQDAGSSFRLSHGVFEDVL
jgi:hypothetical protein